MRFAVLGSGSKGNALVVDGGGVVVLVDCGYSPRELRRRMASLALDLRDVKALLLTHGHGDHMKGARQLAGTLGIPTFTTEGTVRFSSAFGGLRNVEKIVSGAPFRIAGLDVHAVATPHDAPGSVCFTLDDGADRLGVCTDLGHPAAAVGAALHGCHALVVETNYDDDMLQNGPYPLALKRRVGSDVGHLSNTQGAQLLQLAKSSSLTRVLCAHLSEVNNTDAHALAATRPVVDGADIELTCAPQHHPTGWLRVRRAGDAATHTPPTTTATPTTAAQPKTQAVTAALAAKAHGIAAQRQLAMFSTEATAVGVTTTRWK